MTRKQLEDLIISQELALDNIMLKNGITPDLKDMLLVILLKGMLLSLVATED